MRILIALTYYTPYVSGVTEFARMLAEHLAASHEVTVLATQHDPHLPREEIISGIKLVRSPVAFRLHKGVVSPASIADFRRLARDADVINLHLPMLEAGLLAWLCDRRRLVTMYQCDLAVTGGLLDRLAVLAARMSASIALARSTHVTVTTLDYACSSPIAGKQVSKLVEVLAPVKSPPDAAQRPPLNENDKLTIGFVGRFVEEKGLPVLLEAFARAQPAIARETQLVLVGQSAGVAGGSVMEGIDHAIHALGTSVTVTGKVSEAELWRLYESFDILVLPSVNRYEAFGMVQVEAMMTGALVVASDLPGVRTIVGNTGCGVVARTADSASLADALVQAARMRSKISRAEVRNRVSRVYAPLRSLEVQEALFTCVASQGSAQIAKRKTSP